MSPVRSAKVRSLRWLLSVFCVALGFFTTSAPVSTAAEESRPNVVLIMLDDFGYECVGANGSTSYKTPSIDKLATTGMRFEHCYVQPLCTPTRVQLMTGIYNVRNYFDFGQMDPNCVTFANLFRDAGYATCIAGKWQLGQDVSLPQKFGFEESYLWQHTRRPERYKNPGLEINGEAKDWNNGEYGPELVNQYALDFITRKKDGPFFLYYPMILTHSPYVPTPDSLDYNRPSNAGGEKAKGKGNGKGKGKGRGKGKANGEANGQQPATGNRYFADMVTYADKLIGRVVARLDELGIRDNTLLIVLGDNGTGRGTRSTLNGEEFLGGKGLLTHRGMHVPLVVNWPAQMRAGGRVSRDLIDSTDFLPTICEAAGISVPSTLQIDGQSFCPQLRGEPGNPRKWYYSWYAPRIAFVGEFAANHEFKLYRDGRLFDLRHDPEEEQPLAAADRSAEATAAAAALQQVLDRYRDARPPELVERAKKGQGNRTSGS